MDQTEPEDARPGPPEGADKAAAKARKWDERIAARAGEWAGFLFSIEPEKTAKRTQRQIQIISALRNRIRIYVRSAAAENSRNQRLTVLSYLNALEQRFESSNGNPLHAWNAIGTCTRPGSKLIPLPNWCAAYLHAVAENFRSLAAGRDFRHQSDDADEARVSISFEQAEALVNQALGLTKRGASQFRNLASDRKKIDQKLEYDRLILAGMRHEDALDEVGTMRGRVEEREATKKAIQAGKRLLNHVPVGARQPKLKTKIQTTCEADPDEKGKK